MKKGNIFINHLPVILVVIVILILGVFVGSLWQELTEKIDSCKVIGQIYDSVDNKCYSVNCQDQPWLCKKVGE